LIKFSDIWTIDKTHNKFLVYELKMRFKPLNFELFRAQAIFNAAQKRSYSDKTSRPPALENLSLQNFFVYSTL
jgi:hypothetical protein